MLRAGLERSQEVSLTSESEAHLDRTWCVSSGSAAVLGLCDMVLDAAPTTAYLMLGERCQRNCAFCAQARGSHVRGETPALSRVLWPRYDAETVAEAIAAAYARGGIARACFQVTVHHGYVARAQRAVARLAELCTVPICVSIAARTLDDIDALLAAGAERVTLALDAATPALYHTIKGGAWRQTWDLLEQGGARFPGHIGTHLIVGLGETEREMVERIQRLDDLGVTIGLFSLTPVRGSAWEDRQPPELESYRRVQATRWLIVSGVVRAEALSFDERGRIIGLGLGEEALRRHLADGEAFETAGCPGCNRPYYNERPSGPMYNYPRALAGAEAQLALDRLLDALAPCAAGSDTYGNEVNDGETNPTV